MKRFNLMRKFTTSICLAVSLFAWAAMSAPSVAQTAVPVLDADFEILAGAAERPWLTFGQAFPDEPSDAVAGQLNDPGVGAESLKVFGNFPDPGVINFGGVFQDILVDGTTLSVDDVLQLDAYALTLSNDSIAQTANDAFLSVTFVANGTGPDPVGTEFGFRQARSVNIGTLGEDEWFRVFTTEIPIPSDAQFVRVKAVFEQSELGEPGAAWFDNFSLNVLPGASLICDADGDGGCDITDLNTLYGQFGAAGSLDLNGDGTVEAGDIFAWLDAASDPSNTAKSNATDVYVNGDVNLDGSVGSGDLGILLNNFNDVNGLLFADGNLNDDANVNSDDLGILLNSFGHTSAAAVTVPEPGSFLLLLMAMTAMAGFMRTRR